MILDSVSLNLYYRILGQTVENLKSPSSDTNVTGSQMLAAADEGGYAQSSPRHLFICNPQYIPTQHRMAQLKLPEFTHIVLPV